MISAPPSLPPPLPPLSPVPERSQALADALARVSLGDRAAFAQLYRLSSATMLGAILRINSNRAQAEDVLQECFVNIWRAAQSYDAARSQPLTWLVSIARNRAIDSLRRQKTEVSTVSSHAAAPDGGDDVDLLANHASPDAGPLELLQQATQARQLGLCLGLLTAQQQQCVAMAYYQGLSHTEVAQQLAQPLGTVKSWVRRALMSLKDCLSTAAQRGGV